MWFPETELFPLSGFIMAFLFLGSSSLLDSSKLPPGRERVNGVWWWTGDFSSNVFRKASRKLIFKVEYCKKERKHPPTQIYRQQPLSPTLWSHFAPGFHVRLWTNTGFISRTHTVWTRADVGLSLFLSLSLLELNRNIVIFCLKSSPELQLWKLPEATENILLFPFLGYSYNSHFSRINVGKPVLAIVEAMCF